MARRSRDLWDRLADAIFEPTMDTLLVGGTVAWAWLLYLLFNRSGATSAIAVLVAVDAVSAAVIWVLSRAALRQSQAGNR